MTKTPVKRLLIGLATCFFIISTVLTIGCTGNKIKVKCEPEGDSGYSKDFDLYRKGENLS